MQMRNHGLLIQGKRRDGLRDIEVVDWSGEGLGTGIVKPENGLKSFWSLYPYQGNLYVTILQCFYPLCC